MQYEVEIASELVILHDFLVIGLSYCLHVLEYIAYNTNIARAHGKLTLCSNALDFACAPPTNLPASVISQIKRLPVLCLTYNLPNEFSIR